MPTPPRPRSPFSLGGPRLAAIGVVAAASALLVGYFVWMVQPAAAREITAACKGLKANPDNKQLGKIPRPAPDFTVRSLDGKAHKLSDYRGKVVLVHFWAAWCGACIQEEPSLAKMADEMTSPDFQVVTVASDVGWDPVKQALPHGAPFQVFLDPPDEEGSVGPLARSWGTTAVPESFLVDRGQHIRMYFDNRRDWDSSVAETCLQSVIDE